MDLSPRKTLLPILVLLSTIALPEMVTGISVGSVVTRNFFNVIKSVASSSCEGKTFYTRAAFLNAAKSFPTFGDQATALASKREIAAFFAHVTHETGHFCYIREIQKSRYCDTSSRTYPCKDGKWYYGRGPIQITWNYNYGAAGKYLGLDLLSNPGLVATHPAVSFKTALWFWKTRVEHLLKEGFGATIRAVNGGECKGGNPTAVANRVRYYKKYCAQFGITPGPNLSC